MACKLTRRSANLFEGSTGATVKIELTSDRPARITHLFYAGEPVASPFEFDVKAGKQTLLLIAVGVAGPGETQRMVVTEAGTPPCPLRLFVWSTIRFSTKLDIEGV
jgi:hypothetical protein